MAGLVFTSPAGAALRRGNFRRRVWLSALLDAGLPVVHSHDLRHTGNNLTAAAGANLRELMARVGHSSTRAALIYLHSTDERQREIADALGGLAARDLKRGTSRTSRPGGNRSDANGHTAAQGCLMKINEQQAEAVFDLLICGSGAKGTRTPDPLLAKNVGRPA